MAPCFIRTTAARLGALFTDNKAKVLFIKAPLLVCALKTSEALSAAWEVALKFEQITKRVRIGTLKEL